MPKRLKKLRATLRRVYGGREHHRAHWMAERVYSMELQRRCDERWRARLAAEGSDG